MSSISGISNPMVQQLAQQANSVNATSGSVNLHSLATLDTIGGTPSTSNGEFGKQLMDVINQLNDSQQNAAQKETDFMTGQRKVDYHDLMISMEKASISLQLAVNVRNKLLDAYQTLSSMQV